MLAGVWVVTAGSGYATVGPLKSIRDKNQIDQKQQIGYTGAVSNWEIFFAREKVLGGLNAGKDPLNGLKAALVRPIYPCGGDIPAFKPENPPLWDEKPR